MFDISVMSFFVLQMFSCGIWIFEVFVDVYGVLLIDEFVMYFGVYCLIVYCLLWMLEDYGFVLCDVVGVVSLGVCMVVLVVGVVYDLQVEVFFEFMVIVNEFGMMCFFVVFDGVECIILVSVEFCYVVVSVVQCFGVWYLVIVGVLGKVILVQVLIVDWFFGVLVMFVVEVDMIGVCGFVISYDEVILMVQLVVVFLVLCGQCFVVIVVVYVVIDLDDVVIVVWFQQFVVVICEVLDG